jgi:drug/metabolite transporter (DMT)-like permease
LHAISAPANLLKIHIESPCRRHNCYAGQLRADSGRLTLVERRVRNTASHAAAGCLLRKRTLRHHRYIELNIANGATPEMPQAVPNIAVVRGASNAEIEDIFRALTERWQSELRLAGVVAEGHGMANRTCPAGYLRSLATGARFSIFRDRGPGTAECHLDRVGVLAAGAAVQHDIAAGCDLVLLNKFGQLEVAGNGLADAFRAALATHLPLLTSVSPPHDPAWRQFADRQYAVLSADLAAIDRWRRTVQTRRAAISPSQLTTSEYLRGALYAMVAVSMWAGWVVAARLGVSTSLTPWDITAIRFGVAGVILLPYLLKQGFAIERLGWWGIAAIMVGGGAPMVLVSYVGLLFAPARHAASLYTGLLPLNVAILAALVLGEAFTGTKRIGLALILPGVLGIVWDAGAVIGSPQNIGHVLFIGAGMLSAAYFVAMRKGGLNGLHAAAIAAVGSLIAYVPIYVVASGAPLANAPWRDIALQALVQGVLTSVISQVLFGRAVTILGASRSAAFAALSPAITALLAIPLLGEWPTTIDWIAITLISCGVYFVSGGPLPAQRAGRMTP